jgi:hypothetical protein
MASLRSFSPRQVLCVLALAVPVLAIFAIGAALAAWLIALYRDTAINDRLTLALASICSLIVGLFLLVFHIKHISVLVPCKNRQSFMTTCRAALKDLGYEVHWKANDQLVSRPSFRALLLGGRIHVDAKGDEVRISGPKVFVEILRRRLRVHSHLAGTEQSRRLRHGDRLLKRVQISLRFTPQQWGDVGEAVLETLSAEGADVYCEVHLMAQSKDGIPESFVEGPLRDWLKQENIQAEVHKDHVRWEEPLDRTAELEMTDTHLV